MQQGDSFGRKTHIDMMDESARGKIEALCEKYSVPPAQVECVINCACALKAQRLWVSALTAARKEQRVSRCASLKAVIDAVEKLQQAISKLDTEDEFHLRRIVTEFVETERLRPNPFDAVTLIAAGLSGAAGDIAKPLQLAATKKNGRSNVRNGDVRVIFSLLEAVEGSGMRLSRKGDFADFCAEIFWIAGIAAAPDGALRMAMEDGGINRWHRASQ